MADATVHPNKALTNTSFLWKFTINGGPSNLHDTCWTQLHFILPFTWNIHITASEWPEFLIIIFQSCNDFLNIEVTLPQNRWHDDNTWWVGKNSRHKVLTTVSTQFMMFQKSSSKYFYMWHTISKFFHLSVHNLSLEGKSGARFIIVPVLHFINCCANRCTVLNTKVHWLNQFSGLTFCNANHRKSSWPSTGSQHKVWEFLF